MWWILRQDSTIPIVIWFKPEVNPILFYEISSFRDDK